MPSFGSGYKGLGKQGTNLSDRDSPQETLIFF